VEKTGFLVFACVQFWFKNSRNPGKLIFKKKLWHFPPGSAEHPKAPRSTALLVKGAPVINRPPGKE
jgi:hypothetical protein